MGREEKGEAMSEEITEILSQFSTSEIMDAYLGANDEWALEHWLECDPWRAMPSKYFIAELFRRVSILEEKLI
jgi:hypothetical protein